MGGSYHKEQLKNRVLHVLENNEYSKSSKPQKSSEDKEGDHRVTLKGQPDDLKVTINGHTGNQEGVPLQGHPLDQQRVPVQGHTLDLPGSPIQVASSKMVYLPKQQQIIYDHLLMTRGFSGQFNAPQLRKETGITVSTIRKCVAKLKSLDILRINYNSHVNLFLYHINTTINVYRNSYHPTLTGSPKGQPYNHQGVPQTDSSSSLLSNKTTTDDVENILTTHPELGYWRQKGLTSKQMKDWVKISSSIENLIQSLCYCRYEMVDLNLEESKPIDNVFNWFFKIIEKAGSYPKPKDYQSFEDKQIKQERVALEEKEKRVEELKSLSRKKWQLDREETFWEMMNDPDGNLYKECHGTLNNFAKKLKGKVLESSMRSAFDKIMNERDKGT